MQVLYGENVLPAVRDLITNEAAGGELRLVAGYFDPKDSLKECLARALSRNVRVTLITRGGRSERRHGKETAEFEAMGMAVMFLPWLHAKLYISSMHALSTSMNLTENIAYNHGEMAVSFGMSSDKEGYRLLCGAYEHFREKAMLHGMKGELETTGEVGLDPAVPGVARAKAGLCIRCRAGIPLNPEKPLCRACYTEWAKYENASYREKFCHECGASGRTTLSKPICRTCRS